jgi:ABC-type uncharacterized transport system substrate-binding protein
MDTKKTHTTPEAIRHQAKLVLETVENFKPHVVVVLDDNAIREVMLPLIDREDIAVVFSGMNGQPETYNQRKPFMESRAKPGSNITGVYEKLHVGKSLVVMETALSGFTAKDKVVGITDYTPTGNAISRQFELELADGKNPVNWELKRVKDFSEYQSLIHKLNADNHVRAIYPAALSLKTESGETYTAPKIFAWTTANSRNPEMALNYYFAKIGLFGGAAVDFTSMGKMAGYKVANILAGKPAGNVPIEEAPDYAIVFNLDRAKELGVTIPEGLLTAADFVYHQ